MTDRKPAKPILLAGLPGAGKSSTLAKLAARAKVNGWAATAITCDLAKAGAIEQLATYAKALEMPAYRAKDAATLRKAVAKADANGAHPHRHPGHQSAESRLTSRSCASWRKRPARRSCWSWPPAAMPSRARSWLPATPRPARRDSSPPRSTSRGAMAASWLRRRPGDSRSPEFGTSPEIASGLGALRADQLCRLILPASRAESRAPGSADQQVAQHQTAQQQTDVRYRMMVQETRRTAPTAAAAPIANAIAVASGKGGVGKTWLSITLAHALANLGRRTVLIDGDLGLANVDIQLGLSPEVDLADVLDNNVPLAEAAQRHEATGLDIVAGRSGVASLATLSTARLATFGRGIAEISGRYDRVLIDLGAGVERPVRYLAASAQRTLVVTNDEPTSLTDAYALIKLLVQDGAKTKIAVVVNAAASKAEGERTYKTLAKACDTFLKMTPPLLGVVRRDAKVRDAIRAQTPLLTRHPGSDAARDIEAIAQQLAQAS